jgi:hypothetical protein
VEASVWPRITPPVVVLNQALKLTAYCVVEPLVGKLNTSGRLT